MLLNFLVGYGLEARVVAGVGGGGEAVGALLAEDETVVGCHGVLTVAVVDHGLVVEFEYLFHILFCLFVDDGLRRYRN